jgi:hypothetical protein
MQARKPAPPHDDPEQSRRFIEVARQVGADENAGTEDVFARVVRKLGATPKEPSRTKRQSPKKM